MKSNFSKDVSSTLKYHIDETSGFLTADVTLARVGVQHYYGFELGIKDRAFDKIGVLRAPEEVFADSSLSTFKNLVSTNDHPVTPVTVDNVKALQVGQVSEVTASEDQRTIKGTLTITDSKVIEAIKGGKREVSVGYTHNLTQLDGEFEGKKYEYAQTDIKANHLAIVVAGRCGPECNIVVDHKGDPTMKITIGGITFDTDNEQLAQAITQMTADHSAALDTIQAKADMAVENARLMTLARDEAEAKADTLEKGQLTHDAISALVSDRAALLVNAKQILGDKMPECKDCPVELKAAVIDQVSGIDVSGKSEDYVNAAYDMAITQFEKGLKNQENLRGDFKKMNNNDAGMTVDAARAKAREAYLTSKGLEV